jgi:phage anti-repressor protein
MSSNKRIVMYSKDIMRITGKGEKYSRNYREKIREKLQKEEHQFISVEEFCDYTGLKTEQVRQFMND